MTDLLGKTDLQTSANADSEYGSVGYDGSASGVASASEHGADLSAVTNQGLTYETEHASGSADLAGALGASGSQDGVDVDGALDGAGSLVTDHGAADVGGSLDGALQGTTDGVHGDVAATGAFDAMLDAMEDLWASIAGNVSAMLGF